MRYNPARQEVILKVVYYGPGLAGKTTNLQFLQGRAPGASELISIDTHSERTLQFDFLATELGKVQGFDLRLDFSTVPGQSYYAATRRQVLAGADGVVFVADSRREALDENIDAMNEMLNNLRHHQLPDDLPIVIQYNKQDLPTAVPPGQLQPLLNVRSWPSFGAAAGNGEGVAETCEALARMLIDRLAHTELPVIVATGDSIPVTRTPAPAAPKSWLITCFRCQSMLDVPSAVVGEIYTCGVCQTQLQVVDPDRGTTRLPQNAPRPITGRHPQPRPSQNFDQDYQAYEEPRPISGTYPGNAGVENSASGHATSGYATGALKPVTGVHVRPGFIAPAGEFPLDGFTVLNLLDENAQGRRLRVRETASGKTYRALVLAPALLVQPGYFETVEPYTRMTGPVQHPNLLHLASFRQNGDALVFLSADPTDHESLAHVLSRRRALAPPHAIGIIRQLALALEEGARHGAIHGWLRPDVVLLAPDGSALLDELCVPPNHRFLVRELAGVSAATEYYLAPEYLNDEQRGDIRADIFLLGALLFRMITGEGLVTGYSALEALHKLTANGPRMLRDAQQGISRELNNFYLKLVAVDRAQRFQTYGELLDGIDRFGGGAKRQHLQLTGTQMRPATLSANRQPPPRPSGHSASGGVQTGRRGGTGPLPSAPRGRVGRGTDPSGGHAILPPTRRQPESNGPLAIVILVLVVLAVALGAVFVLQSDRSHSAANNAANDTPSTTPRSEVTVTPVRAVTPVNPISPITVPGGERGRTVGTPGAPGEMAMTAAQRLEVKRTIADQLVAEQFGAALKSCDRLADPVDKRESQALVLAKHDGRKHDIESMLRAGVDPVLIRKALEQTRQTWGLPGDLEWAVAVQSKADAMALGAPAPTLPEDTQESGKTPANSQGEWGPNRPAPLVATPATPTDPMAGTVAGSGTHPVAALVKPEIPPAVDAAATAYGAVLRALVANQPSQAQAAMTGLEPGAPAVVALRQLIDWWPARTQLINRVAGTKVVKLRFSHPTTNELVDVTAADAAGVTVASASGSSSVLTWGQLPMKVQAKLFADAAAAPGTPADELGGGMAAQLVADDAIQAGVIARRSKTILAEKTAQVDLLIELAGRRIALTVLNKGFDAARAGNFKAASEALAEVRKGDKNVLKAMDAEVERLDAAINQPPLPVTPGVAAPANEPVVGHELPRDLKDRQAALRTLGWEPVGDAWLDGTSVQLLANTGISFEMTKGVAGFTIEAQGSGYLRLIPTRGAASAGVKGGVPLPLSPDRVNNYTVNFTRDAMVVLDNRGTVIRSLPLTAPPTVFLIISTADATLTTVPKPTIP